MGTARRRQEGLIEKIRELPEDKVAVVEDFVDFLRQRDDDRALVRATYPIAEHRLDEVWDNSADAEYDQL